MQEKRALSMNQEYPKRIINFVSICLLILCLFVLTKEVSSLNKHYNNLTTTDKNLSIVVILFVSFALCSTIGIFKKKKWAWIGLTSYILYSTGAFLYEGYKFCLLYTSPSPRDQRGYRMPSSA